MYYVVLTFPSLLLKLDVAVNRLINIILYQIYRLRNFRRFWSETLLCFITVELGNCMRLLDAEWEWCVLSCRTRGTHWDRWTHRCVGCVVYRRAPTLVPFPSGRPFLYRPRPIPAETAKPRSSMLEKLKAPTCSTVAWLLRHRSHETAAKYCPSFYDIDTMSYNSRGESIKLRSWFRQRWLTLRIQ